MKKMTIIKNEIIFLIIYLISSIKYVFITTQNKILNVPNSNVTLNFARKINACILQIKL